MPPTLRAFADRQNNGHGVDTSVAEMFGYGLLLGLSTQTETSNESIPHPSPNRD
jgi:hypothetical protein